jgi:hypothetical protein
MILLMEMAGYRTVDFVAALDLSFCIVIKIFLHFSLILVFFVFFVSSFSNGHFGNVVLVAGSCVGRIPFYVLLCYTPVGPDG